MTAPDAAAIARELGPDKCAALVLAVFPPCLTCKNGEPHSVDTVSRVEAVAAARRLAAPLPVAPKWPDRVTAWFFKDDGKFVLADESPRGKAMAGVPARLVPADAVVLTRADALAARASLASAQCSGVPGMMYSIATLDIELAASAPTEER